MIVDDVLAVLPGLGLSFGIAAAALALGLPLGLLGGLAMHDGGRVLRRAVWVITEIGRGFPALVTLYLVYFGLPSVGIVLAALPAVIIGMAFTTACYSADLFRTACAAVPRSQVEATAALGLNRAKALRLIILPQALRLVLPPLIGLPIIVFQATALAFSIGLQELLGRAYNTGTFRFDTFRFLLIAAVLYLATTVVLTLVGRLYTTRARGIPQFMFSRFADLRAAASTRS